MDEQKPKVQVIPANPFKRYKKEDDVNNGKYLKEEGMLYRFQDAYIDIYSGTSEKRSPAN